MNLNTFGQSVTHQREVSAYSIMWNLDFGSVWARSYKDGDGLIHNFDLPLLKNTKWKFNLFMEHTRSKGGGLKARLTRIEDNGPHEIEIEAEIGLLSSKEGPHGPFSEIHGFKKSKFKQSEESELLTFIDFVNLMKSLRSPTGDFTVRVRLKPNNFALPYPVTHYVRTTSNSRFFTIKLGNFSFVEQNKTRKYVLEGTKNDPNLTLQLYFKYNEEGKDVLGAEITSDKRECHLHCFCYVFDENGYLEIPVENGHHNFENRDVWDITCYKRFVPLIGFSINKRTVHFDIRKRYEKSLVTELNKINSGNANHSMDNCQNLFTLASTVSFGAILALMCILFRKMSILKTNGPH